MISATQPSGTLLMLLSRPHPPVSGCWIVPRWCRSAPACASPPPAPPIQCSRFTAPLESGAGSAGAGASDRASRFPGGGGGGGGLRRTESGLTTTGTSAVFHCGARGHWTHDPPRPLPPSQRSFLELEKIESACHRSSCCRVGRSSKCHTQLYPPAPSGSNRLFRVQILSYCCGPR